MATPTRTRNRATRWLHLLLAALIVHQMVMSAVMELPNPRRGHPGNLWWSFHEYGGLLTFSAIFLFWVLRVARQAGTTAWGEWFPWFSKVRLQALGQDILRYLHDGVRLRMPDPEGSNALPAAVQGVGLLLVSILAVTGTLWWLGRQLGGAWPARVHDLIEIHGVLGDAVWFYLALHVGAALLHEFFGHRILRTIAPTEWNRSTSE